MVARKARQAFTADRRTKAINMKIEGHTWQQIADALGYAHKGAAFTDVQRALEHSVVEQRLAAEAWRELELTRLDAMQQAIWPRLMAGEPRAIEVALKLLDRRAKYLGLDSALKLEVLTVDAIDQQIAVLNEQLAAAGREAGEAAATEGPAE